MAGQDEQNEERARQDADGTAEGEREGRDRARARSAAAAAAADFDPLRIRPYVSLPEPTVSDPTLPEPTVSSEGTEGVSGAGAGAGAGSGAGGGDGARGSSGAGDGVGAGAAVGPGGPPPAATDVRLFAPVTDGDDADAGAGTDPASGPREKSPARRRSLVLLAGAGAVAAVTAATVFAMGLLSSASDGPTRDRALPGDPASAYADPTKPAPPSANPSAPSSRTPSAPPVVRQSPSPTPTASAPSTPPSSPPATARATGSVGPSTSPSRRAADMTLRQGDKGARVTELQGRLAQLYLYMGERDGTYTSEVTDAVSRYQWARGLRDDAQGEYGRETRRSLESETTEP